MENRIKEFRERLGLTQAELADRMGTSRQQVSRYERGDTQLTPRQMDEFAEALGCNPLELLDNTVPLNALRVIGEVQAGAWNESEEFPDEDWEYVASPPLSSEYKKPFGLRVSGSSMNMFYGSGSIVVCVGILQYPHELAEGDHVVVRRRDQFGLFETTLKELRKDSDGKIWLWPRSTDPRYQEPIAAPDPGESADFEDSAADSVKIIAVVVASWAVRPSRASMMVRS